MKIPLTTAVLFAAHIACAQGMGLDPTFNFDGVATMSFGMYHQGGSDLCLQPDGKIVMVGRCGTNSLHDLAMLRFNPNGNLDTSFDGDGKVSMPYGIWTEAFTTVALQPDGKIVAAGYYQTGADIDYLVARFHANGAPDTTFGVAGFATAALGAEDDIITSMVIQPDGKILVAGWSQSQNDAESDFSLARFDSTGVLDPTFSGDGKLVSNFWFRNTLTDMLLIPDGRIVVTGYNEYGVLTRDLLTARYMPDGTLDNSFGNGGSVVTDVSPDDEEAAAIALQPDGKILVAGWDRHYSVGRMLLVRYDTTGALDASFDGDGIDTLAIGTLGAWAIDVLVKSDSSIVVLGGTSTAGGSQEELVLVRHTPDGALDTTYNGTGIYTAALPGVSSFVLGNMEMQPDGKIVTGGVMESSIPNLFLAVRLNGSPNTAVVGPQERSVRLSVFPDPFESAATVEFELATSEQVSLHLYDAEGRLVRTILSTQQRSAGPHQETLDMSGVAPGSYTLLLTSGNARSSVALVKR
ncbi:MAG: T9SS type A sorting domain-containing protein [Flavobacteriales bacterium]